MNYRKILFVALLSTIAPLANAADPIRVSAGRLDALVVDKELRAPATVVPANEASIKSSISGYILRVYKDVGEQVDKGEMLIRIDDATPQLDLARAKAELAALDAQIVEANARLENAEELLAKNFISDEELIARQAAVAVLKANRDGAKVAIGVAELALSRTRIRAPYAATVVERQAQVGGYAQPGIPLLTLVQNDDREVDVEMDPRYTEQLPNVTDFRFVGQGREWQLELARVSTVIEPSARIVRARFVFAGDEARIGTSGQLVWNEVSGVIPVRLIVQRGDELGVFVVDSGKARFVPIPDAQEGRPAVAKLPPETQVVFRGQTRLQDGDLISVETQ